MAATELIARATPFDHETWPITLRYLWLNDRLRTLPLLDEVARDGHITRPVEIWQGNDGSLQVRNGHHRIAVALALGMSVPIVFCRRSETKPTS